MTNAPEPRQAPVPPQNLEAEESVLGAMMLSPSAVDAVAEMLEATDFYRQSHGRIFDAALALHRKGEPVDAITLAGELEQMGNVDGTNMLEAIGGRVRLHELAALVPATANVRHYAALVREASMFRDLIYVGGKTSRLGWEHEGAASDAVEEAESLMLDMAKGRVRRDFSKASEVVRDVYDRMIKLGEKGAEVIGVATGFRPFDNLTAGLQPGNLIVLAARPSMGKSALALCICANVAIHQRLPVALFTLEMSKSEVVQRLIGSEGLVDSLKVRTGRLDSEEWQRATNVSSKIENSPLYIDDSGLVTMGEIRSKARRLKMREPDLALVVVDYLQLMTSGVSAENRVQEISQISRSLKILAGELEVPVLALSQLSRQVEQRHDKRPILSDLRESGAIEQDSDIVAFVYRDEYYNPEETDQAGVAEVNIAKQRNGPTDTIKLSFVKRYARFSEMALPGDMTR